MVTSSDRAKNEIKARAKSLGFCLCGFTSLEEMQDYPIFEKWLAEKQNGEMTYLESDRHRLFRERPQNLVPWAKTAIMLAWPYTLNYMSDKALSGQIAGYVGIEDYHLLLPRTLQPLLDELPNILGKPVQAQVYCDTAPILERELGVRAGLGWIGRNSCLINPEFGSAFLLVEVFLDASLPPDAPYKEDRCGNCHRCINACPANCINPNRTIDANRCISALTIEGKGTTPEKYSRVIGTRVFGCDVCQSVCPWNLKNKSAALSKTKSLSVSEMNSLLAISEESFRDQFKDSAITRAKRRGLIRNLCAVIGNINGQECIDNLVKLLETDPDPVIRASAAQALITLGPGKIKSEILSK